MFLLGLIFNVFLKESLPGTLNEIFTKNFKGSFEEMFKVESLKEFLKVLKFQGLFKGIFTREVIFVIFILI